MFLDTTIFIDYLKANPLAFSQVVGARAHGAVPIHAVVAAELIAGALNKPELRRSMALISTCEMVVPDESDIRRSLVLLEKHALTHGPGWSDCLIAATALRLRQPVVTSNDKHFRAFRGLEVIRPY